MQKENDDQSVIMQHNWRSKLEKEEHKLENFNYNKLLASRSTEDRHHALHSSSKNLDNTEALQLRKGVPLFINLTNKMKERDSR